MKLKKLASIFAATAVMCFSTLNIVCAEDETDNNTTEAEISTSEDGLWRYSVLTDEETKDEYVSIVKYVGTEADVSIPAQIDDIDVKAIGEYAFMMNMNINTNIKKIIIPETLETFDDFSLFGCTSLEEYVVDEGNEVYTTEDGILFGDDKKLFVSYPPAKTENEYTVPDGVIALNPSAFSMCSSLKIINMPDTLERIGDFCFSECTSLNNVVIPEKVSSLSFYTFASCTSLTDITLPDNMHTIGGGAFSQCTSLEKIDFPDHIMEIGQAAFAATAFTEIELPPTIQEIGYYAFGFTTDQTGQIIAMPSFTVKGYEGSMAQMYCSEEENSHITFEITQKLEDATESAETPNAEENEKEETDEIKPGIIVGICVGGIAVLALIIIMVVKVIKGKNTDDETVDEYADSDDENEDEAEEENELNNEDSKYDLSEDSDEE